MTELTQSTGKPPVQKSGERPYLIGVPLTSEEEERFRAFLTRTHREAGTLVRTLILERLDIREMIQEGGLEAIGRYWQYTAEAHLEGRILKEVGELVGGEVSIQGNSYPSSGGVVLPVLIPWKVVEAVLARNP